MITMPSNVNLRSILEENKLIGPNFLDWFRNLRIVLKAEKLAYVLNEPLPNPPADDVSEEVQKAYKKHIDDDEMARCIMLASMSHELQKQHEAMDANTIVYHLRELFEGQTRLERYEVCKLLFWSKMVEGTSPVQHALKMNGYIESLGHLGYVMDHEFSINLILASLSHSFAHFALNYRTNNITSTIPELIDMLKTIEPSIKEGKSSMLVDSMSYKNKNKKFTKPKGGVVKKRAREITPKMVCYHCGEDGHWKRNCKIYLESNKKAFFARSTSGIFVIEGNIVYNNNLSILDI